MYCNSYGRIAVRRCCYGRQRKTSDADVFTRKRSSHMGYCSNTLARFQYGQDTVQTTNNNINEALGRVSSLTWGNLYATPENYGLVIGNRVEASEKSGWLRVVYIIGSESYSGKLMCFINWATLILNPKICIFKINFVTLGYEV